MPIIATWLHGEWKKRRDLAPLHFWVGWFIVLKWFIKICVQVSCREDGSMSGWWVVSLVKLQYVGGFGSIFMIPTSSETLALMSQRKGWLSHFMADELLPSVLWADQGSTFLKTRSMGHPELMSTKSTSVLLLMSSAHLVIVSGKQPSTCRDNMDFRTEASTNAFRSLQTLTAAAKLCSRVLKRLRSPEHQRYLHFHAVSGGPTPTAAPARGWCTWPSLHTWCLHQSACTHGGRVDFHTLESNEALQSHPSVFTSNTQRYLSLQSFWNHLCSN